MKGLADQTLYEILEVGETAAAAEIEAAYERARSLYGPGSLATYTLMTPEEALHLTSRIEEAKATLLDAAARERYDEGLHAAAGDARASGCAASFASLPPVIPAVHAPPELPRGILPPPPGPDEDDDVEVEASFDAEELPVAPGKEAPAESEPEAKPLPPPEPPAARPAILLANPVAAAGPAQPAPPKPIRLEREVASPRAEPAPAAPPPEPVLPEGAPWSGETLRQIREARGITVQQIAERTKVTRYHIENIEAERFAMLPAPVYLRGILLSLARELRLDGQKVARSYLDRAVASGLVPGSTKPR